MVFKPNYNQQRAERNRAKEAKKEAKRAEQEEQVAAQARTQGLWALWHGEGENHHLHLQWDEE